MINWSRVGRLSSAERWSLAQALVLLPLTGVALRLVGFRRWQAVLAHLAPVVGSGTDKGALTGQARMVTQMVEAAARRGPYRAGCLSRSLTLWWLLRRRGIGGDLRIGVNKEAGRFQAHAWVEYKGAVLNDLADVSERYVSFDLAIVPAGLREG